MVKTKKDLQSQVCQDLKLTTVEVILKSSSPELSCDYENYNYRTNLTKFTDKINVQNKGHSCLQPAGFSSLGFLHFYVCCRVFMILLVLVAKIKLSYQQITDICQPLWCPLVAEDFSYLHK